MFFIGVDAVVVVVGSGGARVVVFLISFPDTNRLKKNAKSVANKIPSNCNENDKV